MKVARRCHGGPRKFTHVTKSGDLFTRCPKAWLHYEARAEVNTYADYRWFVDHGTLPRAGGKLDQDPLFVEASGLIAEEIARLQRKAKSSGEK